ncbi:hypothetical protein [Amycolatopsis sp. NPDC051102]|uniref:hypothetical protein n=1 Tax=Amycolatopsis sp. NPDC051102 TaxID=3155163 RepID=UPI003424D90E
MITSAEEFIELRYSENASDYRRAATEAAPMGVWMDVLERYPEARVWVARNKAVPIEIIGILAGDSSVEVRFAVSMKRKLTPELLARLARDTDESVRLQVARHENTPTEVLEFLSEDDWQDVSDAAKGRLSGAD